MTTEFDSPDHSLCWVEGWQAAMDWLAEHKGFEGIALAEEMATRLPTTSPHRSDPPMPDAAPPPSADTIRAALVATGFEYTESLWWRTYDDGSLRLYVLCSDLFHWGTADMEEITDANVQSLADTITECEAIVGRYRADDAPLLWCARQRGMRPQGAYYQHLDKALWPLFDAAGPEREVGPANPHPRHPSPAQTGASDA